MTSEQSPRKPGTAPGIDHSGTDHSDTDQHKENVPAGDKVAEIPTPARDINQKITTLDADLLSLRHELAAINASVEEGLDRLSDTDTDLTAKVSETYKRLGEIDNAYKSLLQISSRIDQDIQRLNGNVSEVAKESANGIKHLEQSTLAQSSEFAQQNQQLVGRLNTLADNSRQTSELLREKIEQNTHSMLVVKQELLDEIEKRSEQVVTRLETQVEQQKSETDEAIENNRARILKLQSVDEAIIKRATTLEITTAELSVQAGQMQSSIEQLQSSNNSLYAEVTELKVQANALQIQSRRQDRQLDALEVKSRGLADRLTEIGGLVDRHFFRLSSALLLLFGFVLILYFYQQAQLVEGRMAQTQQSESLTTALDENRSQRQQEMAALEKTMVQQLGQQAEQQQQVVLKQEQRLQSTLAEIEDRLGSVEGRLLNEAPFSHLGDDNIIHGENWLLQQSPDSYSVQVAVVDSPQAAYELALDYQYYLTQKLSMFRIEQQGQSRYVLLAGVYPQIQAAQAVAARLPAYLERQGRRIVQLKDVQKAIRR